MFEMVLGAGTGQDRTGQDRTGTHLALPREIVRVDAAPVQRDQQVGATIAVGYGELGLAHLLAGGLW